MPRILRKVNDHSAGQKWVDQNFDIKKELKEKNNGTMPVTPAFTTSQSEGMDQWSDNNPPDILFYLQPPVSDFKGREPQFMTDDYGKAVSNPCKTGRGIRDIPILPDQISVDVPGWMIMAWRRIDPRITLQDLLDRMTTSLGEAQKLTERTVTIPKKNVLQNHCTRNCRKLLRYYNEYARRQEPHRAEVEAMEALTTNNLIYNTVLTYHPELNRLIKKKFVRKNGHGMWSVEDMDVTAENFEQTTYPAEYFLFNGYSANLSEGMLKAISMLWTLQERAVKHGIDPLYWQKLNQSCLPGSWFDRRARSKNTSHVYHDGCQICTSSDNDTWEDIDFTKLVQRTPRTARVLVSIEKDGFGSDSEDSEDCDFEHSSVGLWNRSNSRIDITSPTPYKTHSAERSALESSTSSPSKRKASDPDIVSPKRRITVGDEANQQHPLPDPNFTRLNSPSSEQVRPSVFPTYHHDQTAYDHDKAGKRLSQLTDISLLKKNQAHGTGYVEASELPYSPPHTPVKQRSNWLRSSLDNTQPFLDDTEIETEKTEHQYRQPLYEDSSSPRIIETLDCTPGIATPDPTLPSMSTDLEFQGTGLDLMHDWARFYNIDYLSANRVDNNGTEYATGVG